EVVGRPGPGELEREQPGRAELRSERVDRLPERLLPGGRDEVGAVQEHLSFAPGGVPRLERVHTRLVGNGRQARVALVGGTREQCFPLLGRPACLLLLLEVPAPWW